MLGSITLSLLSPWILPNTFFYYMKYFLLRVVLIKICVKGKLEDNICTHAMWMRYTLEDNLVIPITF